MTGSLLTMVSRSRFFVVTAFCCGLLLVKGDTQTVSVARASAVLPDQPVKPKPVKPKKKAAVKQKPLIGIAVLNPQQLVKDVDSFSKTSVLKNQGMYYSQLGSFFGKVEGIDLTQPKGEFFYSGAGFSFAKMNRCSFYKVKDLKLLLKENLIKLVNPSSDPKDYTIKNHPQHPNAYQVISRKNRPSEETTTNCVLKHGYIFIVELLWGQYSDPFDSDLIFDLELPDPAKFFKPLLRRFDAGVVVDMNAISTLQRSLFAVAFSAAAKAKLQQRDNELKINYEWRKAYGLHQLEWITGFLTDSEKVTIGFKVSPAKKNLLVDVSITARPKTPFAKLLGSVGGQRSQWNHLASLDDDSAFSFFACTQLPKADKTMCIAAVRRVEFAVQKILSMANNQRKKTDGKPNVKPLTNPDVVKLANVLAATFQAKTLDFFLRTDLSTPGKPLTIGGIKLANGRQAAAPLGRLMQQFEQICKVWPNCELNITPNVGTHRGVTFHKVSFSEVSKDWQAALGKTACIIIGVGSKTLWFSIGTDDALPALRKTIDATFNRSKIGKQPRRESIRLSIKAEHWSQFFNRHLTSLKEIREKEFNGFIEEMKLDKDDRIKLFQKKHLQTQKIIEAELKPWKKAMTQFAGKDRLDLSIAPMKDGLRGRVTVDQGLFELWCLVIRRMTMTRLHNAWRYRKKKPTKPTGVEKSPIPPPKNPTAPPKK